MIQMHVSYPKPYQTHMELISPLILVMLLPLLATQPQSALQAQDFRTALPVLSCH